MASADVAKSLSPSPPPSMHSACSRSRDTHRLDTAYLNSDLEEIAYCIAMLVFEGRSFFDSHEFDDNESSQSTINIEGYHAKQMRARLTSKMLGTFVPNTLTSENSTELQQHSCTIENIKCRIASNLREKIRQCLRDHYVEEESSITKSSVSNSPLVTPQLIAKANCFGHASSLASVQQQVTIESIADINDTDTLDIESETTANSIALVSPQLQPTTFQTNLVLEVYLLANCCFNDLISKTGGNLIEISKLANTLNQQHHQQQQQHQHHHHQPYSFELLERWNISMITNKSHINTNTYNGTNTKSLLTLNELFQAIRSYLHFSQLSSWINQTKGKQPKNIAFSFSFTNENDTHKLDELVHKPQQLVNESDLQTSNQSEKSSVSLKEPKFIRSLVNSTRLTSSCNRIQTFSSSSTYGSNNVYNQLFNANPSLNDFDFQTFPNINLTFLNNKLHMTAPNKKSDIIQTASNSNSSSLAGFTSISVNLYSRKRHSLTADSIGIPRINCSKLHHQSKKYSTALRHLVAMNSNENIAAKHHLQQQQQQQHLEQQQQDHQHHFYHHQQQQQHQLLQPLLQQQQQYQLNSSSSMNPPASPSFFKHSGNNGLQHYYLPHWSSIMTNSTALEKRRSSIEAASSPNNSDSLLNGLLKQQLLHSQSPTMSASLQMASPIVSLSPSLSENSTSDERNVYFENGKTNTNENNLSPTLNHTVSMSPKMLVSNHQLLSDLCSSTQNQLSLIDESSHLSHKRKLTSSSENDEQEETGEVKCDEANTSKTVFKMRDEVLKSSGEPTYMVFDEPSILSDSCEIKSSDINNNVDMATIKNPVNTANMNKSGINSTKPGLKRLGNFPLSSSPAPMRKSGTSLFGFDNSLKDPRSIKKALTVNSLMVKGKEENGENINYHDDDEDDEESKTSSSRKSTAMSKNELANESQDEMKECVDSNNNKNDNKNQMNASLARKSRRSYANDYKSFSMQLGFPTSHSMMLTPHCLLGSFEESLLNGRMNPVGMVDGFYAEIGASGSFFPEHAILPVNAAFYQVCEDVAASPYLGVIGLGSLGKRGYKVPNKGTIQVTLFNPNKTVVKMFVVMYDLSDMPPNHRTFLRQRTMYVPLASSSSSNHQSQASACSIATNQVSITNSKSSQTKNNQLNDEEEDIIELKSYLRYLIHLRFATSKSGKMYLHTNVKLIFARNKCEIDPRLAKYEYKTFTEAPKMPRYSPKK